MMRVLLFLCSLCAFLPLGLQAQVKASLLSSTESLVPGTSTFVALRLEHEEHWHTYWRNPGTGLATEIEWQTPPGYKVGPLQWPAPKLLHDVSGGVSGHGYEGVVLLPMLLEAPRDARPGETITLHAKVSWLMCKEACVPGSANLQLSLRVADSGAPSQAAEAIALAVSRVPREQAAVSAQVYGAKGGLVLDLQFPEDLKAAAQDLHFFPHNEDIDYEKPQRVEKQGGRGLRLSLPLMQSLDGPQEGKLSGVLALANGKGLPGFASALQLELPLSTGTPPAGASAGAVPASLAASLGLALLGGLILNLMPCVFPVLGIKVLGFVQQAGEDKRKVVLHGLVFSAGVLLSFWSLALVLLLLRSGGDQLGWGFQLQSAGFVLALTVVMLVFALNMSGLFEFGLSATAVGSELQMKQGYSGSFFTGVLATLVATPCSAPFLAPALGAALTLPPAQSFLIFTAIAVGLSLPYLTLSLFPGLVRLLPRPGAWMETFKQAMAFLLYGTVAFLLWVLAGQVEEADYLNVLLGLVLLAFALWDYGRHVQAQRKGRRLTAKLRVLAAASLGLWLAWPPSVEEESLTWEPWSKARVEQLQSQGRPIYVDFTARWCATCQTNKKAVFRSNEVLQLLREKKVALLKADWTKRDPIITEELTRFGRSAVPFNLVYLPGAADPQPLPEILTPGIVIEALGGKSVPPPQK